MATPITSQPRMNTTRFGAAASVSRPAASSAALPISTGRPPYCSIRSPTLGDTRPDTSRPSDNPPITQDSGQPVASAIGFASTAGR